MAAATLPLAARRNRLRRTETRPFAFARSMISAELLHFAPALDGPRADTEERGDLLIRALHPAQLFQFSEIDLRFRPRHESPLLSEQMQFGTPVRKRQAQALDIGMAGQEQRLDFRDLAAALGDSCRHLHPCGLDFVERSAVGFERGFLAGQALPAQDRDIHVLRIEFDSAADAPGQLGGGERCAAAEERFVDQFAALGVIEDRAPHQLDRLLRRMVELLFVRSAHDEFGRRRVPDRRVLAGLAEPGRILLADVPAGFVLIPIVRSRQNGPAFIPDNLLRIQKSDSQQTVENLAEYRSMRATRRQPGGSEQARTLPTSRRGCRRRYRRYSV